MKSNERILKALETNPLMFGMKYCPNHFRGSSPWFHLDILEASLNNKYLAVAAPRESAKSTILAFLYPLHRIIFKKKRFILIVSNTYKKSAESLSSIKKEITDNPQMGVWKVKVSRDAEGDSIFTHADGFETRVLCKGAEQIGSVRGEKFGAYRPDLIIVDDLEDDELVRNPIRRNDLQELFDTALTPAGDKELCQFLIIGTILHDDSLMAKLVSQDKYPEYKKLKYEALWMTKEDKLESLWDYKWSVDDLLKIRKEKPSTFAKEYQNNPVSGLMAKFHKEDFRYWHIDNLQYVLYDEEGHTTARGLLSECKAAIAGDLAWEEGKENDSTVIMPGFLTPQNDILIDTYICKTGMRPSEMEEILFSMEARLRALTKGSVPIGFEKAKLEKVIKFLLKKAMVRRNHFLLFKDLTWDGDKISRIETRLEPRYAQHTIYHKHKMGDLENQLLRFPSATHDDLCDTAQGLVQLLIYPKVAPKKEEKLNEFDWYRKQCIDTKNPKHNKFVYGQKKTPTHIPFKQAYK